MTSSEYDEYEAVIRVPKGADLSQSRKTAGARRGLTRDPQTKKLGHAEIFLKDENEADLSTEPPPIFIHVGGDRPEPQPKERVEVENVLNALVALHEIIKAADKAAPYLKRWWSEQALPFMKSTRKRFMRTGKAAVQAAQDESAALIESTPAETSQEVIAALEKYRASMSSAEAQQLFTAALISRLLSEEQMRVLRNAQMEDENGSLDLRVLGTLTPQQVDDSIKLILETSPSLLDGEIREALRLPDGSR
ncbi:hypothetical protein SUDANB21_04181 [Streptomyces sp. enrichment culture]|uniref:hypothetical protein n=1 Tax=Streptomyces sp. enrichment culture TaxID=1795815 RepID=UPI0010C0F899|nr:hypothetical protein OH709_14595 [Streptomyces cellulosae]